MPTTIGSLPLEVVGQILGSLDEMQSLRHALLACRHFNNAFRETPHNGHRILRNQIPPSLMPLAVAVSKAGSTPELAASPGPLLDALFERPEHLASQLDKLSVQSLGIMSHTHTVIDDFATDFARDAWAKMSDAAGNPQPLHLSPREYIRFLRAFYRTELCYSLCRHRQSARPGGFDETSGPLFFQKLAVWDNEQIGSVQEYFEPRFRQGEPSSEIEVETTCIESRGTLADSTVRCTTLQPHTSRWHMMSSLANPWSTTCNTDLIAIPGNAG